MHSTNRSRRTPGRANHVEQLEVRQLLSNTLMVGPTAPYHTIQSAVDAARKNQTILVAPGTYVEQVVVPSSLSGLTIQSTNGPGTTIIQAPATIKGNYSHDNGYDGLLVDNTSTGNRIDSNVLIHNNRSNVGAWDLEDDTFGQSNTIQGDGGTANFYKNDVFGTTNTDVRSKSH